MEKSIVKFKIFAVNFVSMLTNQKNISEKKRVVILIFIHKIAAKNMQELIVFLKENNFHIKRITKNYKKNNLVLDITNSNFILETNCDIQTKQLRNVVSFLKQYTNINGIFFKNQVLNVERISVLEEQDKLNLWKQIHSFRL